MAVIKGRGLKRPLPPVVFEISDGASKRNIALDYDVLMAPLRWNLHLCFEAIMFSYTHVHNEVENSNTDAIIKASKQY